VSPAAPVRDGICLIVTNKFPPMIGGAGNIYASLARASAGRIHVLCAWRDYASGAEVADWRRHDAASGIHVHRIRDIRPGLAMRSGLLPRVFRMIWQEPMIRLRLLLRVAALRVRYGMRAVCVADDETVGWLIRPAQSLLRCRVGVFCHGDDLAERAGEERTRARRRRQFRIADAIVASSEAAAADLGRVFGVPRERITIISNGVDTARYRPLPPDPALRASLGLDGKRVIATVAGLVPRKGIDQVLRAVARLRNEFPGLHYLVVGDGPYRDRLVDLAKSLGVADRVRFAGQVPADDVPRYLALAELMAMPHRQEAEGEDEGTPLVFLEANACGKPVIAGSTGGGPDLVAHGVNGLCIDGADLDAVTDAVRRLLADPAWARELGAAGLARARDTTWERHAAAFADLFLGRSDCGSPVV
jgi:phosphatidyl-myo-inositol dimannoside synthase